MLYFSYFLLLSPSLVQFRTFFSLSLKFSFVHLIPPISSASLLGTRATPSASFLRVYTFQKVFLLCSEIKTDEVSHTISVQFIRASYKEIYCTSFLFSFMHRFSHELFSELITRVFISPPIEPLHCPHTLSKQFCFGVRLKHLIS